VNRNIKTRGTSRIHKNEWNTCFRERANDTVTPVILQLPPRTISSNNRIRHHGKWFQFNNKYLRLWTKVLLKLTVVHRIKNALTFMELGSPAPRFITGATENYSEPDESSLHPSTLLSHRTTFTYIVIFSTHLLSPGSIVGIVTWRRERRQRCLGSTASRCGRG